MFKLHNLNNKPFLLSNPFSRSIKHKKNLLHLPLILVFKYLSTKHFNTCIQTFLLPAVISSYSTSLWFRIEQKSLPTQLEIEIHR